MPSEMSRAERQRLYDSTSMSVWSGQSHRDRKVGWECPGAGAGAGPLSGGRGISEEKSSGDGLRRNVTVFNTSEVCTTKWVRQQILRLCVFSHNLKQNLET